MAEKPVIRVKAGSRAVVEATPQKTGTIRAFDAGKNARRLRGLPTASVSINRNIRSYGAAVLARSRNLAANNPYAAAAKEEFVSALVGAGIKPSSLVTDAALKEAIQETWLDWTDEADADGLTDLYGIQAIVASEMFEAGECFIRLRPRRPEDGLTVPLQLQLLPAEMLALDDNRQITGGRIEMGVEFDLLGRRVGYHFWRDHPGSEIHTGSKTFVSANEVLHLYKPMRAGQVRGVPHTLSAIVTAAIMDAYDDAELERKRTAALFAAFITRNVLDDDEHPLENADGEIAGQSPSPSVPEGSAPFEPGAMVDLLDGEDVKFASPADVGGNYEAFQYRNLLRMAAGFGVPYAAMTGDLRQTSYGSIRAGLVQFRRRIEAMQHSVMVFQFCRPIWQRWLVDAAMVGAIPISPSAMNRKMMRAKWMPPKWEWIDPLKDIAAEVLAVRAGFKARSDVIEEAYGYDPEETDNRIVQDRDRQERLNLLFSESQFADALIEAALAQEMQEGQATPPRPEGGNDD